MAADVREKEQLEYLFLDLEWNQVPGTTGVDGREAIQPANKKSRLNL